MVLAHTDIHLPPWRDFHWAKFVLCHKGSIKPVQSPGTKHQVWVVISSDHFNQVIFFKIADHLTLYEGFYIFRRFKVAIQGLLKGDYIIKSSFNDDAASKSYEVCFDNAPQITLQIYTIMKEWNIDR